MGGITGRYADPTAFRKWARIGVIIKPFQYWSWLGLVAYFAAVSTLASAALFMVGAMTGTLRRFA
tara:strand:- start:105 stop:299 length:195 start_codon:yes stop_codon:yes gene_type:complete